MLSYRHAFHAGNFADVHKHVALVSLLRHLQRKPRGYCYVDTHAGAGRYALRSGEGPGTEWREGIGRLRSVAAGDAGEVPAEVADYLALVAGAGEGRDDVYPGSPWLAAAIARPQDCAILIELHPAESPALKRLFRGDRKVAVHAPRDADEAIGALLPPAATPRGLVLMDPSYEQAAEYSLTAARVERVHRRWSTATVAVWYPLLGGPRQGRHRALLEALAKVALGEAFRHELEVHPPGRTGLRGSGLWVLNPPWAFRQCWPEVDAWLQQALCASSG